MTVYNLGNMKYADLQRLAKQHGIRANMKADKLLKALKEILEGDHPDQVDDLTNRNDKKAVQVKRKCSEDHSQLLSQTQSSKRQRKGSVSNSPSVHGGKRKSSLLESSKQNLPTSKAKKQNSAKSDAEESILESSSPKRRHSRKGTFEVPGSSKKETPQVKERARKSTYTKDTPGQNENQGRKTAEKTKHNRSGTYEKKDSFVGDLCTADQPEIQKNGSRRVSLAKKGSEINPQGNEDESSPGVQQMIDALSDDMTDAQMKESLMTALDKRVKDKIPNNTAEDLADTATSQIPRYTALAAPKQKATTPGSRFNSAHKKQFNKMQSIDDYLHKKKERSEKLTTSMKKMKMLTEQMRSVVESSKKYQTPPSLLKQQSKNVGMKSKTALFQSPLSKPFVPSVTSTSKASFNFSQMAKKPTAKMPTPARKSPRLSAASSVTKPSHKASKENTANTSILNKSKTGTTPFRFTGKNTSFLNKSHNTSMNSTQNLSINKPKFDLKASLARPLTWKPYTGKLQPVVKKNLTGTGMQKSSAAQIRADSRKAVQNKRMDKRLDLQMKRRGMNV